MSKRELLAHDFGIYSDFDNIDFFRGGLTAKTHIMKETRVRVNSFTVDGLTITAAHLVNGFIQYDPIGADRTLESPTATEFRDYFNYRHLYGSVEFMIENTGSVGETLTLTGGTGVTIDPTVVHIAAGEIGHFRIVLTNLSTPTATVYQVGSYGGGGSVDDYLTVTSYGDVAQVYTAAAVVGGLIIRNLVATSRADTMPTAPLIIAEMSDTSVGATCYFSVRNTAAAGGVNVTITGGVGITYDPTTDALVGPGRTGHYAFTITSATTGTVYYLGNYGTAGTLRRNVTTDATAGVNVLTASELIDGIYLRDPNGADRIDTTPTATLILAGLGDKVIGTSFDFQVTNNANADIFAATTENIIFTSGVGVTFLNGGATIATLTIRPGETAFWRFVCTHAGTPTFDAHLISHVDRAVGYGKATYKQRAMAGDETLTTLEILSGLVQVNPNGAPRALTLDTAVNLVAALPFKQIGSSVPLKIFNVGDAPDELITITAGAGNTIVHQTLSTTTTIAPGQVAEIDAVPTNYTAAAEAVTYYIRQISPIDEYDGRMTVSDDNTAAGITITAAMVASGWLRHSPTASITDTFDIATLIIAALKNSAAGSYHNFLMENDSATDQVILLANAAGVTLSPTTIQIRSGEIAILRIRIDTGTTLTIEHVGTVTRSPQEDKMTVTIDATDNDVALTTAMLLGGFIRRTSISADRADTIATGTQIYTAMSNPQVGSAFSVLYENATAVGDFNLTFTTAASVTLDPTAIVVKPGNRAKITFVCTAVNTFTAYREWEVPVDVNDGRLTLTDYAVAAAWTPITAAATAGGFITRDCNGASRADVLDTAVNILAAMDNPAPGTFFKLIIRNTSDADEVITLTTAVGITLNPAAITIRSGQTCYLMGHVDTSTTLTLYEIFNVPTNTYERRVTANALATVGAGTYTAALINDGLILRDPAGDDRTDTTGTAAEIIAVLDNPAVGTEFDLDIRNTADADETILLAGGLGVTLSPTTIHINSGETASLLCVIDGAATITMYLKQAVPIMPVERRMVVTPLATAGDETITAAMLIGGWLKRDPAGGARTDTLDTVANLVAAMDNPAVGTAFTFFYENTGDGNETGIITTAAGWTLDPATATMLSIRTGEIAKFKVVITAAATATLTLENISNVYNIPELANTATLTGVLGAGAAPTAREVIAGFLRYDPAATNRTVTTPTAVQIIAAMRLGAAGEDFYLGAAFDFYVENYGDDLAAGSEAILTMTAGAGVTLVAEDATIQPGQIKKYRCIATSAFEVSIYEIDSNLEAQCGFVFYQNPIAADLVSVVAAVLPTNAGPTVLGIAAQPDYPRTLAVRLVDGGGISAGTLTLVGVDVNGQPCTETFDLAGPTSTRNTVNTYATLTSATTTDVAGAAGGDTIGIGVAATLGLPCRRGAVLLNVYKATVTDADEAAGAIDNEYCFITPTTAADGANDYCFWYEYI